MRHFCGRTGLAAAVAAIVIGAPGPAVADPYPAEPPASSVSDGTVPPGGFVTFSGRGFLPYEKVSINIDFGGADSGAAFAGVARFRLAALTRLTTTATAEGTFSIQVKLVQVGTATLVATGLTSGVTITQEIKVLPSTDENGGGGTGGGPGGGGPGGGGTGGGGAGGGRLPDAHPGAALPATGQPGPPLLPTVAGGLCALLAGSALLWFTRGRRRKS
jgi:hypothetical protein